jgi:hypothetical protein
VLSQFAVVTSIKEISNSRKLEEKRLLSNGLLNGHLLVDEEFGSGVDGSAPSITKASFDPLDEAGSDGYATQILYQVRREQFLLLATSCIINRALQSIIK